MKIAGLQKMTLLDYPGKIACTVFLDGCNFRCPFCHNAQLLSGSAEQLMDEEGLLAFLRSRTGLLDAVCISGGEPTLSPRLPALLKKIREMGFLTKLDTNGYRPEVLRELLDQGLLNYVAMDLKNAPGAYAATVGLKDVDMERIAQSIRLLDCSGVDYELRTTVVQPLHDAAGMTEMARWLLQVLGGKKAKALYLQPFADRDSVVFSGLCAPTEDALQAMRQALLPCAETVALRGI